MKQDDKDSFVRVSANISHYHRKKLMEIVFERNIPIGRLLAIAIDNELLKEKPFEFDVTLPEDAVEYAYIEQASKILSYLKNFSGLGLDSLVLLRHDIGITNKEEFLYAFKELLDKELIEGYPPKPGPFTHTQYPKGYLHYTLAGKSPKKLKEQQLKNKRYEKLQRLKKEFKDE